MRYFHQMNNQDVNSGGWGGNQSTGEYQKSMHYFMQNKFYPAIPDEIRNLIAQVKVPSTEGNDVHRTGVQWRVHLLKGGFPGAD